MSTQLLFYEQVRSVSKENHADFSVDGTGQSYEFAKETNSVPVTAVEIPLAARAYSIVFAGEDDVVPVAILGIEGVRNSPWSVLFKFV